MGPVPSGRSDRRFRLAARQSLGRGRGCTASAELATIVSGRTAEPSLAVSGSCDDSVSGAAMSAVCGSTPSSGCAVSGDKVAAALDADGTTFPVPSPGRSRSQWAPASRSRYRRRFGGELEQAAPVRRSSRSRWRSLSPWQSQSRLRPEKAASEKELFRGDRLVRVAVGQQHGPSDAAGMQRQRSGNTDCPVEFRWLGDDARQGSASRLHVDRDDPHRHAGPADSIDDVEEALGQQVFSAMTLSIRGASALPLPACARSPLQLDGHFIEVKRAGLIDHQQRPGQPLGRQSGWSRAAPRSSQCATIDR